MKNYVQPGDVLDFTAPAGGLASGEGHLFGALFGVAATNAAAGVKVAVKLEGVFTLPKASGGGFAEGAPLYWDAVAKKVTGTAAGNTAIGHAAAPAAADAASALVRLAN